eukprot:scaffold111890_cov51-Phaeocystis_antarctica.AAC.1
MSLYDDLRDHGITCDNEAEMRAYFIVSSADPEVVSGKLRQLPAAVRTAPQIQAALRVLASVQNNDPTSFFRELRRADYLTACLMHPHLDRVRERALQAINRALREGTELPLADLQRMLMLESDDGLVQARTLATHFGLKAAASGAEAVVLRRGELRAPVVELDGRQREKPLPGMVSSLIEAKRSGVPVAYLLFSPQPPALLASDADAEVRREAEVRRRALEAVQARAAAAERARREGEERVWREGANEKQRREAAATAAQSGEAQAQVLAQAPALAQQPAQQGASAGLGGAPIPPAFQHLAATSGSALLSAEGLGRRDAEERAQREAQQQQQQQAREAEARATQEAGNLADLARQEAAAAQTRVAAEAAARTRASEAEERARRASLEMPPPVGLPTKRLSLEVLPSAPGFGALAA